MVKDEITIKTSRRRMKRKSQKSHFAIGDNLIKHLTDWDLSQG